VIYLSATNSIEIDVTWKRPLETGDYLTDKNLNGGNTTILYALGKVENYEFQVHDPGNRGINYLYIDTP